MTDSMPALARPRPARPESGFASASVASVASRLTLASIALALVVTLLATGCGCSENTVHIRPGIVFDTYADATLDILPEGMDVPADVGDVTEVDGVSYATDVCHQVAYGLMVCGGFTDPYTYGNICARMSTAARQCTLETDDVDYICDCLLTLNQHPDCPDVCAQITDCLEGVDNPCAPLCPSSSEMVLQCTRVSLAAHDCDMAVSCMVGLFSGTCDEACTAAAACGFDVDDVHCPATCSEVVGSPGGALVRGCLDTATWLGDCEALAACGGLGF